MLVSVGWRHSTIEQGPPHNILSKAHESDEHAKTTLSIKGETRKAISTSQDGVSLKILTCQGCGLFRRGDLQLKLNEQSHYGTNRSEQHPS